MFGGPPPQPSPAELRAQEEEAALTVQRVITWSILLYLSPFAVKSIQKPHLRIPTNKWCATTTWVYGHNRWTTAAYTNYWHWHLDLYSAKAGTRFQDRESAGL
ncbi:hypothetical protein EYC84_008558 [Monilinia fructicola]|uniref:Uncharacterized protein n=1 Tax=Monilinia fructicola TaxID=38448 RepID=A0A5M9JK15_MONFR|nr:hypothetical protein EYC84_008558 [Monilinia fructicola]